LKVLDYRQANPAPKLFYFEAMLLYFFTIFIKDKKKWNHHTLRMFIHLSYFVNKKRFKSFKSNKKTILYVG